MDTTIAATIMNGDSYSRGMAPSSSSTKIKQEGGASTDKKPSTDSRGHGSSRDYPVRSLQNFPLVLFLTICSVMIDGIEATAKEDVLVLQDIEARAHLAAMEM